MPKIFSNCRICVICPRTSTAKKWTKDQIEKWVKQAGGALHKEFDPQNTTHLVVEEQLWKNKTMAVQLALEANANGGKVCIVTPQWLDDCLVAQRKHREKEYLWERIDQEAAGEQRKKRGKQSGEGEGEEGGEGGEAGPKSHQAMLGEVLQEGTEDYVGDHDRRVFEAENAERQKAEKEREEIEARRKEQEKQATEEKRKAHRDLMKKSVKKGRGEDFNANYHVFKDTTGFEYDCTLTKVDTLTNRNERIVLTLYESNTDNPPNFATNMHFAGTGKQPRNNILAALGSNRLTAMRMWRKAFEEKTGVGWDDRIKAHNERVRDRARDGDTPGLYSTRRGENGDIKSKTRAAEDAVPFEKRKFEYMPPLHAARGWLPEGKEEIPEVLKQNRGKADEHRERTEQWTMTSGGNGYDPNGPSSSSPRKSIEDVRPVQIDLTEDDPADESDALVTPGVGDGFDDDGTGAAFGAANVTATGVDVNGGPSSEMDTGAYADSLLNGTHSLFTQGDVFDTTDLAGQQQQQFNFDQDDTIFNFGIQQPDVEAAGMDFSAGNEGVSGDDLNNMDAAPATGDASFQTTMPSGESFNFSASLPGQTQLAADIGQELLGLGGMDSAGASALVVIPEVEQLEAAAGVEKRKRKEDETDEDMEPAAKRVLGEDLEDGEITA